MGDGFHSQRILGFALNDILGTLALAGITSYTAKVSFLRSAISWFALAESLHYLFGARVHNSLSALGSVENALHQSPPKNNPHHVTL